MRYLGIAKKQKEKITMPDGCEDLVKDIEYDALEINGRVLLIPSPLDREKMSLVERLADRSIKRHRKTLEGLRAQSHGSRKGRSEV